VGLDIAVNRYLTVLQVPHGQVDEVPNRGCGNVGAIEVVGNRRL
jgi:hypothetical protein